MFKNMATASVLAGALLFSMAAKADAVPVSRTFGPSNQTQAPDNVDYEGFCYDGTSDGSGLCGNPAGFPATPPASILIGTFSFTVPAGTVVYGGSITGTFGDQNTPTSAFTDLYLGDGTINGSIEVASCNAITDPDCFSGSVPFSWSYSFDAADLTKLAPDFSSGSLELTAVQNSVGQVVVGAPSVNLLATPEPASIINLAGGLLAFAGWRRRK